MYAIRLKQKVDGKYLYVHRNDYQYDLIPNFGTAWKRKPAVHTNVGDAIAYTLHIAVTQKNQYYEDSFGNIANLLNITMPNDPSKWPSREQVFDDLLEIVEVEFKEI